MVAKLVFYPRPKAIGKRLKMIREDLGVSQKKLSTDIGIAPHNFSRYETGHVELPIAAMEKLYILGYNLNWLICNEKEPMKKVKNESYEKTTDSLENEIQNLRNELNDLKTENNQLKDELLQRIRVIVDLQNQLLSTK